jgi:hypothetical protein
MGQGIFSNVDTLKNIYILSNEPFTVASNVFYGADGLQNIYVPDASVELYKTAEGWSQYAYKIKAMP